MLRFKEFLLEGPNRKELIKQIFSKFPNIEFHREAIKGLSSAPNDIFKKGVNIIKGLKGNPRDDRSKQMHVKGDVRGGTHKTRAGLGAGGSEVTPIYSYALGKYRIIYKKKNQLIVIERFALRKEAYRDFGKNVKER